MKKFHKIKNSTFIIALILIIQTGGLALALKANFQDQQFKKFQINNLIDEIGELKNQNLQLSQRIDTETNLLAPQNQNSNEIQTHFSALKEENSAALTDYSRKLLKLEQENITLQNSYEKQAKQNQSTIAELLVNQKKIQQNSELNKQIEAFLVLGENRGLTDTIMLIAVNTEKKTINFISIPRDLYYEGRKINEYEEKFGIEKLESALEKITGLSVDAYLKINFDAFKDFINLVGGLDITIEENIIDDKFPGENNSYLTVEFKKGLEHMDGERALQYARTRKSTSDFDRMKRQQQIMINLKDKVKTLSVLNNLSTFYKIYQSLQKNINTNLNLLEILNYFENYKDFSIALKLNLNSQNYLYSSKSSNGQYILLPQDKTFQAIKTSIQENLEK